MNSDSSESKTEAPTPRRLRQAREQGQVARSKELSAAISLLTTLLCVIGMAPWAAHRLAELHLATMRVVGSATWPGVQGMLLQSAILLAQLSAAPLLVASASYLCSSWLQAGSVFSMELIKPLLSRMNPVEGTKRLFSLRSLVQLGLSMLKAGVISVAISLVCMRVFGDALRVVYAGTGAALTVANSALTQMALWCGGLFVLLGLVDLVYQRWQHIRDLKMSPSEVRREQREDQGDGKLKSKRKEFADAPIAREQLAHLHMATLVVTDDERAFALVYRPKHYPLPFCLVRGDGTFAAEIVSGALAHRVPVARDPSLLKALYSSPIGTPIPAASLAAVLDQLQLLRQPRAE